jgi:hypothetical protein
MKKNMLSDRRIDVMFVLLLFGSMLVSAVSFPMKLLAEINNNSPIQFKGKVNASAIRENCTLMTNASATSTPQEIHKPLPPKSSQEIQKEKEEMLKSKLNTSVFTQELANPR